MLGWSTLVSWGFWLLIGVAAYFLLPPLLILATQKMAASPELFEYDAQATPPPPAIASYFERNAAGLQACGFRRLSSLALPNAVPNVRAVLELFVNDETLDVAMVTAIFGMAADGPPLQTRYVEFMSEFQAHELRMIQTNNNLEVNAFAELPDMPTFRFPHVSDVPKLYRLHQALVERHAPRAAKKLTVLDDFRGDVIQYLQTKVLRECYQRQVATGYLRYDPDRDCFVPTFFGAYKMTWKVMWPGKPLIQMRFRHEGRRLEEDLLGFGE